MNNTLHSAADQAEAPQIVTCSVAVCDRPVVARGLCSGHYQRFRLNGDPGETPIRIWTRNAGQICSVEGCNKPAYLHGWCAMHEWRWERYRDLDHERELAPHGTYSRYQNQGCRCDECRQANTDYHRERNHRLGRTLPWDVMVAQRRAEADARDNHGTETRYTRGCRCRACKDASAEARRRRRARVAA